MPITPVRRLIMDDLQRYLKQCVELEGMKPKTVHDKRRHLEIFFEFYKKPINQLTINDVVMFSEQLDKTPTVKWKIKKDLRAFIKWANESDLCPLTYTAIKNKLPVDNIRNMLTDEQFRTLDRTVHLLKPNKSHLRWDAIIHFLDETGLRIGELVNIDLSQVDFNEKIFLVKSEKGDHYDTGYFQYDFSRYLNTVKPKSKLFELSINGVANAIKELALLAGCPGVSAHQFRHRYITRLLINGAPTDVAQRLARHKDIKTTMRYRHIYAKELKDAYDSFMTKPKIAELSLKVGKKKGYKLKVQLTKN